MEQHREQTSDIFNGYFILPPLLSVPHTGSGSTGWASALGSTWKDIAWGCSASFQCWPGCMAIGD